MRRPRGAGMRGQERPRAARSSRHRARGAGGSTSRSSRAGRCSARPRCGGAAGPRPRRPRKPARARHRHAPPARKARNCSPSVVSAGVGEGDDRRSWQDLRPRPRHSRGSRCARARARVRAAGLHDAALGHDVHDVGLDVVEQALVVGDDQEAAVRRPQRVDAVGDDAQGVDVEAGIGLVEEAEARLRAAPSAGSPSASSRRRRSRR